MVLWCVVELFDKISVCVWSGCGWVWCGVCCVVGLDEFEWVGGV